MLDTILLRGAIGVGKTTVLLEIGDLLDAGTEPYALLDLDWLAWTRPADDAPIGVRQILAANLTCACRTFRQAGVGRLVLARAVESAEDIIQIGDALGTPSRLTVVHLTASPDEVTRRLTGRDAGDRLSEHLGASERFAGPLDHSTSSEIEIATDERGAGWVARDVLRRTGWTGR